MPFFVRNFGTFGINLNYTLRDFGKRRAAVRQAAAASYKAKAELLQANLAKLLAWAELQRTVGRSPGVGAR